VDAPDRRLRLVHDAAISLEEGWWRFEVSGRNAKPLEKSDPPEPGGELVRGCFARGWLFSSGRDAARLRLVTEEPAVLAPVRARRWLSGDLIFEGADFESEIEDDARRKLERLETLGDVRGVAPALRAAYGFALMMQVARDIGVPLSAIEVRAHAIAVAEEGRARAEEILRRLATERHAEAMREHARRAATRPRSKATRDDAALRAEHALSEAGARLLASRLVGANIEVTFDFMGERFISTADALTLQVWDAGVCLAGADSEVTLESLPSVLREAIEDGVLVITRHA
jgi:hypothetical protein